MNMVFRILLILVSLPLLSCAHSTPVMYFSRPEVCKTSGEAFDVQVEPIKLGNPFYVAFKLTVTNKTDGPIEINWNKTRYIHGTTDYGLFVFKGIDPESIKAGIPKETIPAGDTLSKQISPLKTLGFRSRREIPKPGQSNFYPAILPNGINSVALVVTQGDHEWKELLKVQIGTREIEE